MAVYKLIGKTSYLKFYVYEFKLSKNTVLIPSHAHCCGILDGTVAVNRIFLRFYVSVLPPCVVGSDGGVVNAVVVKQVLHVCFPRDVTTSQDTPDE